MFHPLYRSAAYTAQYIEVRFARSTSEKVISGTGFFALLDRLFFVTNCHNLDAQYYDSKYGGFTPIAVALHSYDAQSARGLANIRMDTAAVYVYANDREDFSSEVNRVGNTVE